MSSQTHDKPLNYKDDSVLPNIFKLIPRYRDSVNFSSGHYLEIHYSQQNGRLILSFSEGIGHSKTSRALGCIHF